ncbi:MAG: hypothetical protein K8W52_24585 [Deltaproteobacteria bacterium]|nr:hypothetical protein [Deltaproteobacteria bacterium]
MSALDRPRLHFLGEMAAITPTANNNNYDLVVEPQSVSLYPKFAAMSDDQFRQAMKTLVLKNFSIVNEGIVEVLEGNWNFYGDNSVQWRDVTITGYDPPSGARGAADPIVGQPLAIFGNSWGDTPTAPIIVDIDPTSDFSSQMFLAQFTVGSAQAGFSATANEQAFIPRTHSHWLDLARNVAMFPDATFAATWQLALPNDTLAFTPGDSKAIDALATAARGGLGLVARFTTYYFNRKYTDPQLAALYAQGQTVQNESAGVLYGTIAPWLPGQLGTVPGGRRLNPVAQLQNAIPKVFVTTYGLAPACAQVDPSGTHVVLDLIAAFRDEIVPPPPLDAPPPPATSITKVDYGVATLQVVDASGTAHDIGPVPYDQTTYMTSGGIVEVPIPDGLASTIATGTLQIVAPGAPFVPPAAGAPAQPPLLAESAVVAESDERATYVTLGESATITVNVRQLGAIPAAPVPVLVQQYRSLEILTPTTDGTQPLPAKLTLPVPTKARPVVQVTPQGAMSGPDGNIQLTITGVDPGMCILVFTPSGDTPPPDDLNGFAPGWAWLYFVHVRVLPSDADLDAIADADVTWELVYEKVLRYYYKLFPVMDQHLQLNDKQACMRGAQILMGLTDASAWNSTLYMPVTRELSDGRRRLLHRWCQRVLAGEET